MYAFAIIGCRNLVGRVTCNIYPKHPKHRLGVGWGCTRGSGAAGGIHFGNRTFESLVSPMNSDCRILYACTVPFGVHLAQSQSNIICPNVSVSAPKIRMQSSMPMAYAGR